MDQQNPPPMPQTVGKRELIRTCLWDHEDVKATKDPEKQFCSNTCNKDAFLFLKKLDPDRTDNPAYCYTYQFIVLRNDILTSMLDRRIPWKKHSQELNKEGRKIKFVPA